MGSTEVARPGASAAGACAAVWAGRTKWRSTAALPHGQQEKKVVSEGGLEPP